MITTEKKLDAIKKVQAHKKDSGSSSVQVSILTDRINEITSHLKSNKHDYMARRGLLQMVGQRRKHLRYIASKDSKAYLDLIKKLGIRK
ncbi:MAG TPA: 30S ribosomal protein S15 [Patescibacteria group bacterium]|nr:30S ribosomal protein S15 [Patescibacteria group bacterium]